MGYIFQSINVIDYYFQSKTQLKYTLIAQNLAFFIILIFRIYLLISKSSVVGFAIATLIENAISSLFLIFLFKKYAGFSIFNWKFSKKVSKKLLIESFPLMLASIASTINMRVDQVMLGTMLNKKEVGIFAAAVRISEIWFLVPAFLGMTIYPSIILARERDYSEYRKKVHKIVFIMSTIVFPFALIVTFFSEFIVKLLYGESFVGASQILSIHIWSGVPYVAAFAYGQVFYAESLTKLTSYTAFYTVAVNLTLNYFLIPRFGAVGAAYTSMISAISAFVLSMVLLNKHSKIFSTKLDFHYEKK
jgi:O-antigen/teichoic acid export membrane protein